MHATVTRRQQDRGTDQASIISVGLPATLSSLITTTVTRRHSLPGRPADGAADALTPRVQRQYVPRLLLQRHERRVVREAVTPPVEVAVPLPHPLLQLPDALRRDCA